MYFQDSNIQNLINVITFPFPLPFPPSPSPKRSKFQSLNKFSSTNIVFVKDTMILLFLHQGGKNKILLFNFKEQENINTKKTLQQTMPGRVGRSLSVLQYNQTDEYLPKYSYIHLTARIYIITKFYKYFFCPFH